MKTLSTAGSLKEWWWRSMETQGDISCWAVLGNQWLVWIFDHWVLISPPWAADALMTTNSGSLARNWHSVWLMQGTVIGCCFGYIAVQTFSLYFHLYSINIRNSHINEYRINMYSFTFHKELLIFSCFMSFSQWN